MEKNWLKLWCKKGGVCNPHVVGYANLNTPLYPQRVTVNEYRSQQDKPHKDVDVDTTSTFFFCICSHSIIQK